MRKATLRDARKFGWYPGVTTIIKCAAAPQLEEWKRDQVLLAALTLPRLPNESDESFCRRVINDSQEQGRKAADGGTLIHKAVQNHYEGVPPDVDMWDCVKGVVEIIEANFPGRTWIAEKACAHTLGYGTKVDLSCADVILDFKSKEFTKDDIPKLCTFDEHDMQLGAGREALVMNGAEAAICYVSRSVRGLAHICRVDEPELRRGWSMFKALHAYWCDKNKYYPAMWERKAA